MAENDTITIEPALLYTKSKYARDYGLNRVKLDEMIRERKVKTLAIKGSTLVVAERR